MTKSTASYTAANSATAALYQGFQGVLSAQFNAVLTKTTDTGQISTFNVVPVATVRDYEVFRFTDALQGTAPIFVKVNYAMDSTGFAYLNVTVGTSTNGAGTLGGVTVGGGTGLPLFGIQQQNSAVRYVYASSDGSQLVFVANLLAPSATTGDALSAIIVERTRDADGTPNATGYLVYHWKSTTEAPGVGSTTFAGVYPRLNDPNAVQPAVSFDYNVAVPNIANITSGLYGSTAYAFPVYGYVNAGLTGASKALMLGFPGDFGKEIVTTLTHYGTAMSFLPLPQHGAQVAYQSGQAGTASRQMCPLLRFE